MADKDLQDQEFDESYDGMKGFAEFEAKQKEEEAKAAAPVSEDVTPTHVREAMEGSDEDEGEGDDGNAGGEDEAGEDGKAAEGDEGEQDAGAAGEDEGEGASSDDNEDDDGETDETRGKPDNELTEEQREKRRASRYRRKFGKERSRAEEAEAKLAEAERKLQELSAAPPQQQQPKPEQQQRPAPRQDDREIIDLNGQPLKKPDPKDFEYDTLDPEYTSAMARYEGRKAFLEARQEAQQAEETAKAEQARNDTRSKFEKMIVDAEGDYDDFAEKVVAGAKNYKLSKELFELALEEPEGGRHVLYHLASNPTEAERIAGLTPAKQGVEFDRLISRFSPPNEEKSDPPQSAQTAATKRATKATGPVKGVKGSGRAKITPSKQSFAEFEAAELAREAAANK